jgi:hypothetical protein
MELIIFLRRLWRRRIQLGAGALVALAIAVAIGPSPAAPAGLAATRVLIDTPSSQLIATAPSGIETMGWRATLLALLLGSGPARAQIARETHLPVSAIAITDPALGAPATPAALPVAAIQAAGVTPEPYVLTVGTTDSLPVVELEASAPDRGGATRLVEAAVHALQAGAAPQDTQYVQGLRITQTDPVMSVQLPGGGGHIQMAITAVVVFVLWCAGVAIWARRRPSRRRLLERARASHA